MLYTLNALPYGYYGQKFTPSIVHITLFELYLCIFPVCVLYLHEGEYTEGRQCRRCCAIYGLDFNILIARNWRFICSKGVEENLVLTR